MLLGTFTLPRIPSEGVRLEASVRERCFGELKLPATLRIAVFTMGMAGRLLYAYMSVRVLPRSKEEAEQEFEQDMVIEEMEEVINLANEEEALDKDIAMYNAEAIEEEEEQDMEEMAQRWEALETEAIQKAQCAYAEAEAEKWMERRMPPWMTQCQWFKPQSPWKDQSGWSDDQMFGLVVPDWGHKDFDKWHDQVPHPQNEHEEHEFFLIVGRSFEEEFQLANDAWMEKDSDRQLQRMMP